MAPLAHNDRVTPTILAGCGGCLLLMVAAVVILWIALTKTGLMPVPFPGVNAAAPAPTRIVEPALTADISKVIASAAIKSIGKEEGMEIAFTEGMLTALLRQTTAAGDMVISERVQVAIQDGGPVELYVPIKINGSNGALSGRETVAMVQVTPSMINGQINLDIKRLQLGRLRIPLLLTAGIAQRAVDLFVDSELDDVGKSVRITDIVLTDGAMTIKAAVDPKALLQ